VWLKKNAHVLSYITEESRSCLHSKKAGVYGIFFIIGNYRIAAYIGESAEIGTRLKNHMKVWFGNGYSFYWNGWEESEFIKGNVVIDFEILAEENDILKRLEIEKQMICQYNPVLQDDVNGLFEKYYKGNDVREDICIIPFNGTRRLAWERRLQELKCV
jgi:hypothetical protein